MVMWQKLVVQFDPNGDPLVGQGDPDFHELLRLCHRSARGRPSIASHVVHSAVEGDGFAIAVATIKYADGSVFTRTGWAWVDEGEEGTFPKLH
jgi:hypothetical protein